MSSSVQWQYRFAVLRQTFDYVKAWRFIIQFMFEVIQYLHLELRQRKSRLGVLDTVMCSLIPSSLD